MSKSKTLPPEGAQNISEILIEVGWALTCWEEAESAIVSLYEAALGNKVLFEDHIENFCKLGRTLRIRALKKKIESISHVFKDPSPTKIIDSLKRLEQLSTIRNEIAHGVCTNFTSHIDGEKHMDGLYILPSLLNGSYVKPSPKYAHNIETIRSFWSEVRELRWVLMQAQFALLENQPDDQGDNGVVPSWTIDAVVSVLQRRQAPQYINEVVKKALEFDEQNKIEEE